MTLTPRALIACSALLGCMGAQAATTVDLGVVSQFSALTFGDFNGLSGDTLSLLGVGGNATLQNWNVNANNRPDYAGYSLIVAGDLQGTDGQVTGRSHVAGAVTTNGFSTGTPPQGSGTSPLNFGTLATTLRSTSASTANVAATGTVTYGGGGTLLTGTGSDVEVFNIDGVQLSNGSYLASTGSTVRSNATVILNISGANVSLGSFGINLAGQSSTLSLLLNFYQATQLSFSNIAVEGAVLAPWAAVTGTSGHVGGTLIAQSFSSADEGHFDFRALTFTPALISSPVPEPATWALFCTALLAAPWVLRGHRRHDHRNAALLARDAYREAAGRAQRGPGALSRPWPRPAARRAQATSRH